MFNGFDYGKGLKKLVEAHKRGPASQRQRRSEKLIKQFEGYCKKFMEALNNSGATNPGLLKNAAEVIVETAKELRFTACAYGVFAEMVNRSRKVPVIPGLANLVDSLLELETEQKTERLSLLNWRITTGNMRVDRYLDYQSQRARLSGNAEHWKDFCWGLIQVIQKGTVKPHDGPALAALEVLQKKQHELGDRIVDVLMLLAEARFAQKNLLDMEKCLLEVATRTVTRSAEFYELLDLLLSERADACWELHQLSINHALEAVASGKLGWSTAEAVIARARKHKEKRLDYLLEHDQMVALESLGTYVFEAALSLPDSKVHQALLRWPTPTARATWSCPRREPTFKPSKGLPAWTTFDLVVHPSANATPRPTTPPRSRCPGPADARTAGDGQGGPGSRRTRSIPVLADHPEEQPLAEEPEPAVEEAVAEVEQELVELSAAGATEVPVEGGAVCRKGAGAGRAVAEEPK
jgi:hypothetical protein